MPARIAHRATACCLALLFWCAAPASAAKVYRAEQYTVRVEIQPGGALHVTETIRFAFGPDSFTTVYRELPERGTDGVTFTGAWMDEVPMERGDGPGQFEIRKPKNRRRRVVFHFAPVTSAAHTFTLTYVAEGVVRVEAEADILEWELLPTDHDYVIERADAEIVPPGGATVIGFGLLEPDAPGMRAGDTPMRLSRSGLDRDEAWPITVRFAPRTVAAVPPRWQLRQMRTGEYLPLFLGLGALVLLMGAGGFVLVRLNHRPELPDEPDARAPAPPEGLPVALAGAVTGTGASVGWPHMLGALLDLARRGVLRIEPAQGSGVFKSSPFQITRTGARAVLAGHEQALLDALFTTTKGPRDTVSFSEITRAVTSSRRWKRIRQAVISDLRAAGLVDAERERLRGRMTLLGIGIVIAGVAGLVVCVPLLERVGDGVLILPAAMMAAGFVGIVAGATVSVLSVDGERRARAAKGYKRYLADVSKPASASSATSMMFDQALPYAAAFGVAVAWAKHLAKQGVTSGPPWLGALAQDPARSQNHMAVTIAMLSAGSHAGAQAGGHAAGGAGAAGAAGGGSSGAG